jgi:transcriptional regulator with XRE-family HTH domain
MTIGNAFQAFRQRQAFSQGEMAERLGISQSLWSLIERGKAKPSDQVRDRMLAEFGEEALHLFDSAQTPSDLIWQLIEAWDEYARVREILERLVDRVDRAAIELHPYQLALDSALERIGGTREAPKAVHLKSLLDLIIGPAAIEGRRKIVPPPKEQHPSFTALAKKVPLSQDKVERLADLLQAVDGIGSDDLEMLVQIARRLRRREM